MKSFLKISLIYIFIFELIFQLLIFFDFKFIKIPDLFYMDIVIKNIGILITKKQSLKLKQNTILYYLL